MPLKHDPIYKELIQALFKDFMQFAFEDIYRHINYKTVRFLDKEVFDSIEEVDRKVDVFAEANIMGKKEIIYIHIEIESSRNNDFPYRMWEYYSLLHRKFKRPIIPIALFVDDKKWSEMLPNKYEIGFMDHNFLSFNYKQIKLKNFKVQDYIKNQNPIVQALLAKMDLSDVDAKKIKLDILRYLFKSKNKIGKKRSMLYNFVETYFTLSEKDEEEINNIIIQENPEAKMLIQTFFEKIEEKAIEKGRLVGHEKGREEGREEGQILATIKACSEVIASQQVELEKLKAYFASKQLPTNLYKEMSTAIKKKIEHEKKELRLLKNKLKKFR